MSVPRYTSFQSCATRKGSTTESPSSRTTFPGQHDQYLANLWLLVRLLRQVTALALGAWQK